MKRPDSLLEDLAVACRQLAQEGHEDGAWGHLSVRDPNQRGFWLKRNGAGLGEIEGPDDFVLLDFDGKKLEGAGGVHFEWPIHAAILRARSDVSAVGHSHAMPFRLFADTDVPLQQLMTDSTLFADGIPRFRDTSHLISTARLGDALAASLGEGRAVLLAQHGAAIVGETIPDMAVSMICLSRAIQGQMALAATGWRVLEAPRDEALAKAKSVYGGGLIAAHWAFYQRRDELSRKSLQV